MVSGLPVVETDELDLVLETGQIVVEIGMVEVTTVVDSAGQFFTVGAQLVMVCLTVEYTVLVVISTGVVVEGVVSVVGDSTEVDLVTLNVVGDSVEDDSVVVTTSAVDSETGEVVTGNEVDSTGELDADTSETGHTVVEMAMVEVTTAVELAGQFTTAGAHLVMVATEVV